MSASLQNVLLYIIKLAAFSAFDCQENNRPTQRSLYVHPMLCFETLIMGIEPLYMCMGGEHDTRPSGQFSHSILALLGNKMNGPFGTLQ